MKFATVLSATALFASGITALPVQGAAPAPALLLPRADNDPSPSDPVSKADRGKTKVWKMTDTNTVNQIPNPDDPEGPNLPGYRGNHDELSERTRMMGGQHAAVVTQNAVPATGGKTKPSVKATDLVWTEKASEALARPNAEGAPTAVDQQNYTPGSADRLEYKGTAEPKKTNTRIEQAGKEINEAHGQQYKVGENDCDTFAEELADKTVKPEEGGAKLRRRACKPKSKI